MWDEVRAAAHAAQSRRITDLFATDPDRAATFSVTCCSRATRIVRTTVRSKLSMRVTLWEKLKRESMCAPASAEKGSEHPISRAIVAEANNKKVQLNEPSDFAASPGHGLACRVRGKRVLVGSRGWMRVHGLRKWAEDNACLRK